MANTVFKYVTLTFFVCMSQLFFAQKNKSDKATKYPTSFTIELKELDQLFASKANKTFRSRSNVYLNKSVVLINSSYKENKQLKLKLSFFKNAELYVQINGNDSKIIYILSSDDSVFYNSKIENNQIVLTQCKKDDILTD